MRTFHKQKGMTLIEVMVSITLGLIFIAAALGYLLSAHGSQRSQDSGARIQENARFAFDILRDHIRKAGYSTAGVSPAFVSRVACNAWDPCSDDVAGLQGDRLAFEMQTPTGQDCLGNNVGVDAWIANVFWVEVQGNISSLYCRAWDVEDEAWTSAAQPLVDGIESIQAQYGVDMDGDFQVDQYFNATDLEALPGDQWVNVKSARIAILASSGQNTTEAANDATTIGGDASAVDAAYQTFTLLDADPINNAGVTRIRRMFTNTVVMNNAFCNAGEGVEC